jgi:DNA-binding NtrC family response regulator
MQSFPLRPAADRQVPSLLGSVLIVEDESFVRKVTAEILQVAGYTVFEARNAVEGLRVFREHKDEIALMVVDVVLPGKSGQEMARELMGPHPYLRTVFISGYPDNAVSREHDFSGRAIYLAKPFSVDSLMRKVKEAIDGEGGPGPAESGLRV